MQERKEYEMGYIENDAMEDPMGDDGMELTDDQLEGIVGGTFVIELPEDEG